MTIDKDSSGLPGMNVQRRATKVNLGMVIGIAVFFAVAAVAAWGISRRATVPGEASPAAAAESKPASGSPR